MRCVVVCVYLLCVAEVLSHQEDCVWDLTVDKKQGLDPRSLEAGATSIARLPQTELDEQCTAECCKKPDCHLAVIGKPADQAESQCLLINCMKDGRDVCVLTPSDQFRSYKKSSNSTDYCRLQKAVGLCRAAFPRFYYNVVNQTCELFIYGGCEGNRNNFENQSSCEAACAGVTGDVIVDTQTSVKRRMAGVEKTEDDSSKAPLPEMTAAEFAESCQAKPKVGPCRASMPRFYYRDGVCQQFIYGGCHANKNNYLSEEECMKTCTVKIVEPKKKDEQEETKNYKEVCTVPADTGLCRAAFRMFYFEPSSQSCLPFTFGGCGGNKNRYDSLEECMSKCAGKSGTFEGHGHSRWTPAFFLVATLAIISIVLLVGLLLITSRRARPQMITLDDKQELLPEEYLPAEELPKQVSF